MKVGEIVGSVNFPERRYEIVAVHGDKLELKILKLEPNARTIWEVGNIFDLYEKDYKHIKFYTKLDKALL